MPTLQPDPKRRKSGGSSSHRRDVRLSHDGARHADAQRLHPPPQQPVVIVGDNSPSVNDSPINFCEDDVVPSAGNQDAVVLVDVDDQDPSSDDEYSLDVRHRMYDILTHRDVGGNADTYSRDDLKVNFVNPLIQHRAYLLTKTTAHAKKNKLSGELTIALSSAIPLQGGGES